MRRSLRHQPDSRGDQLEGVSFLQVNHTVREHQAVVYAAALQRPLQVAQAQGPTPVQDSDRGLSMMQPSAFFHLNLHLERTTLICFYESKSFSSELFQCPRRWSDRGVIWE